MLIAALSPCMARAYRGDQTQTKENETMDAAIKSHPYPGYTTAELLQIATGGHPASDAMLDEIARRQKAAAGDISVMFPTERLRYAQKQGNRARSNTGESTMTISKKKTQSSSPRERFNWGYWDGLADRAKGRTAVWAKTAIYRCKHPYDQAYGRGYWDGYYETSPAPVSSEAAWRSMR